MGDNIRVAVRVRPLIQREIRKNDTSLWHITEQKTIYQLNYPSVSFSFDRVFSSLEDNKLVYEEICSPIVKYVLQGFNGTIFAYGQTSSGKTYTMLGEDSKNTPGVLHHTISEIFRSIQNVPEHEFILSVSFMEIYNEKIRDLLDEDKKKDLKIQEDKDGFIRVTGLSEKPAETPEDVLAWMKNGEKRRHIGETLLNQKSSRSHSIFRMNIIRRRRDVEDADVNISQLNLVDLAGSERVNQTGTTGARFKESVHINKSLSMLTTVISQLSEQQDFVNFRDSKLTRLLQNSLGGNAHTAIICTVTPATVEETRSTLQFASRAKTIRNNPQVNAIKTDQSLIKRYEKDLKLLNEKLEASKMQNKQLEEKNKQNEALKQQIEDLKSKFVAQLVQDAREMQIQKISRRETWGGHLIRRNLTAFCTPRKMLPSTELPTLEEDPDAEFENTFLRASEASEESIYHKIPCEFDNSLYRRSSTFQKLEDVGIQTDCSSKMEDIAIQTEGDFQEVKDVLSQANESSVENDSSQVNVQDKTSEKCQCEYYEKYRSISEHTEKIESELNELRFFTNLERQVTFHELNEMTKVVEERLLNSETYAKNVAYIEAMYNAREADWNAKTELLVKDLEDKYEQEMANQENKIFEEMKAKITELKKKHLKQESEMKKNFSQNIKELETFNEEIVLALKAEHEKQVKDLEFQTNTQISSYIEKNKELTQKIQELEKFHADTVLSLKAEHEKQVKDLEIQSNTQVSSYLEQNKKLMQKIQELEKVHDDMVLALKAEHEKQVKDLEFQTNTQISSYIEKNKELTQKIQELEKFHADTVLALKAEHEKHVKDLEFQSNTQISPYLEQNKELMQKIQELEKLNAVSTLKTDQEKQIEELELQLNTQISSNQDLKNKIEHNKREMFTTQMKYSSLLDTLKRKYDQGKKQHELDKQQLEAKSKEIEELKVKLTEKNSSVTETSLHQMQAKLTHVTSEKDSIFKEYSSLKRQVAELQSKFEQKEDEFHKQHQMIAKEFKLEIKAVKEKNQALLFELDQKKAKIVTLEHNNSTLVKELTRSSKHSNPVASKTEAETQSSSKKMQSDCNLISDRKEAETKKIEKSKAIYPSSQSENEQEVSSDLSDHDKALLMGGSGPVNMYRAFCLEHELKKKDKEISKLKKELQKAQSLFTQEAQQIVSNPNNEAQPKKTHHPKKEAELKKHRVVEDITNEFITQKIHPSESHPYPPGAIPKVMPKGILKRKRMEELENKFPTERVPDTVTKSKPDGIRLITGDSDVPNCKQQ